MMKKPRPNLYRISEKPAHEKLTWPGLNAKDHLSRVVSLAVKEAKETREKEDWAENQIARVLDFVGPQTAVKLISTAPYPVPPIRLSSAQADAAKDWRYATGKAAILQFGHVGNTFGTAGRSRGGGRLPNHHPVKLHPRRL